eukprot:5165820-Ditylum_brightwellii.AAC.1
MVTPSLIAKVVLFDLSGPFKANNKLLRQGETDILSAEYAEYSSINQLFSALYAEYSGWNEATTA